MVKGNMCDMVGVQQSGAITSNTVIKSAVTG